jgi:hypothetical protein
MKTLHLTLFALLLSSCAAFQGHVDKFQAAVDKIEAHVTCTADVLGPYEDMFTRDQAMDLLNGKLDPVDTLTALEVTPADIRAVSKGLSDCGK